MTTLKESLINRISIGGPITVADYMAECLFHPTYGYYVKNNPFGAKGDFITAPAISQMFGEMTATWLIECWRAMGKPSSFNLCEIGPGDGTWMGDIVRTIGQAEPALLDAATAYLIEKSPRLAKLQKEKLSNQNVPIHWINSLEELSKCPTIIITNELFDAVPVRQFVKTDQGWLERVISLAKNGDLIFTIGTTRLDEKLLPLDAASEDIGAIFEYAPAREALMSQIATCIGEHSGAGLFIDYGHAKSAIGDTLQAVKAHKFTDVLDAPGDADLTSHVDFEALNIAAKSAKVQIHKIITQADFLTTLGLVERAGRLGTDKKDAVQQELISQVHRLAGNGPNDMGDLFKVMSICSQDLQAPAPFEKP